MRRLLAEVPLRFPFSMQMAEPAKAQCAPAYSVQASPQWPPSPRNYRQSEKAGAYQTDSDRWNWQKAAVNDSMPFLHPKALHND